MFERPDAGAYAVVNAADLLDVVGEACRSLVFTPAASSVARRQARFVPTLRVVSPAASNPEETRRLRAEYLKRAPTHHARVALQRVADGSGDVKRSASHTNPVIEGASEPLRIGRGQENLDAKRPQLLLA